MNDFTGIVEVDIEQDGNEYHLIIDVSCYVKGKNRGFKAYESVDPPDTGELEYTVTEFTQIDYDEDGNKEKISMSEIAPIERVFSNWKLDTYIENVILEKIEADAE